MNTHSLDYLISQPTNNMATLILLTFLCGIAAAGILILGLPRKDYSDELNDGTGIL